MLAASIVDWAALGKVVVYSFAGALLLTGLFTTGVLAIEVNDGRPASMSRQVAGVVCFGLCLGLVAFGIYVMFTTK
jgi:hypothetical protein